jgi:molecular chaperone GrpE
VLADFRAWLSQAAAGPADNGQAEVCPQPAEPPDLHTLLGQLVALRQEVNLQTRATRAQQEQTALALDQLGQTVEMLRLRQESPAVARAAEPDEAVRPLLKTLIDLHDALSLAAREVQRVQTVVLPAADQLIAQSQQAQPVAGPPSGVRLPLLARLFGAGKALEQMRADREHEAARQQQAARQRQESTTEVAGRVRDLVSSMVTGYTMSVQRLERALQQFDLQPVATVGQPFDPECMEAVEVVARPDLASSEVLEEVRRGYLWRGRLFRCAQVRVARPGS